MKKLFASLLTLLMAVQFAMPAFAAGAPATDTDVVVTEDAPATTTDIVEFALTTPAPNADNTITGGATVTDVTVGLATGTDVAELTVTKKSSQEIAVATPTDVTATVTDVAPEYTKATIEVDISDISKDGGSKSFDVVVSEKNEPDWEKLTYKVTITVYGDTLTAVSLFEIAGVKTPIRGRDIADGTITSTAEYTGTYKWYKEKADSTTGELEPASGKFKLGEKYTARIELTAKRGYAFKDIKANAFKVDGTTASNAAADEAATLTVDATYPALDGRTNIELSIKDSVLIYNTEEVPFTATATDIFNNPVDDVEIKFVVLRADRKFDPSKDEQPVPDSEVKISKATSTDIGIYNVEVTPDAGPNAKFDPTYYVRAYSKEATSDYAEFRLDVIPKPDLSKLDDATAQKRTLTTTTATVDTLRINPVEAVAPIGLVRDVTKGTAYKLTDSDIGLTFVGTNTKAANEKIATNLNKVFTLTATSESTIALGISTETDLKLKTKTFDEVLKEVGLTKGSYKANIALTVKVGDKTNIVKAINGTFTIKFNKKMPTIKAASVTLNSNLSSPTDIINITGGDIAKLMLNDAKYKKASQDMATWITIANADGDKLVNGNKTKEITSAGADKLSVSIPQNQKKASSTVYLKATLEGWKADKYVTFALKVTSKPVTPSIKLASSTVYFSADPKIAKNTRFPLTVLAKSATATLSDLGVTGNLRLPTEDDWADNTLWSKNQREKTYKLANPASTVYEIVDGVLKLKEGKSADKQTGKLVVLAEVEGAAPVKLAVTVKKASTKMKLTPTKKTVSLNPEIGESYENIIKPGIVGLDLTDTTLGTLKLEGDDKLPKGLTATLTDVGNVVVGVSTGTDVTYVAGKSYSVKLTYTPTSGSPAGSKPVSTTIKVSTPRKPTDPTASLKMTGSLDLSNPTKFATVTVSLKNTLNVYDVEPTFTIKDKDGNTIPAENFEFTRISATKWRVQLAAGFTGLAKGSYKINIVEKTGTLVNCDPTKAPEGKPLTGAKINFTATKAKATLDPKAITLYKQDPADERTVKINLPATAPTITNVEINKATTSKFKLLDYKGDGTVTIGFNGDPVTSKAKSTTLTLNIYLDGNTAIATTAKIKVTVK